MSRRWITLIVLLLLTAVAAVPAFAAGTGLHDIAWIKIKPNGIMLALDGFDLQDVDANACADPGLPYFWMPNTVDNYEERYAALLSALNGDREVSIAYWGCGDSPGVSPLVQLGNVTIH